MVLLSPDSTVSASAVFESMIETSLIVAIRVAPHSARLLAAVAKRR
jgi:hypothetical protein